MLQYSHTVTGKVIDFMQLYQENGHWFSHSQVLTWYWRESQCNAWNS